MLKQVQHDVIHVWCEVIGDGCRSGILARQHEIDVICEDITAKPLTRFHKSPPPNFSGTRTSCRKITLPPQGCGETGCVKPIKNISRFTFHFSLGFTLAEILITLTIIGVVAAMTIPNLISAVQDMQYKSAYKRVYSNLAQALQMANNDKVLEYVSGTYDNSIPENFKNIMSYMRISKTCYTGDKSGCFYLYGEGYNALGAKPHGYPSTDDLIAVDTSGASYSTYAYNYTSIIFIDTNSLKGPNQMGKDRFAIYLCNQDNTFSSGIPIKIKPAEDNNYYCCNLNKCETDKNYYGRSWILGK